jgi:hypothetical protein
MFKHVLIIIVNKKTENKQKIKNNIWRQYIIIVFSIKKYIIYIILFIQYDKSIINYDQVNSA